MSYALTLTTPCPFDRVIPLLLFLTLALIPTFSCDYSYADEGDQYLTDGQYEYAIRLYDLAIGDKPDHAHSYNNRGIAYSSLGKYEQAIADYGEAIRLNPEDADAYNNRGAAYNALGKSREAELDFAKAKELGMEETP